MGNCLITKLKSNVQDNNLIYLGEAPVEVNNAEESAIEVKYNDGSVIADNYRTIGNVTTTIDEHRLRVTGTGTVEIKKKYEINHFALVGKNITINMEDYIYSPINVLYFSYNDIAFDVSLLNNITTITHIIINNSGIIGDISSLGSLTNMLVLNISGSRHMEGSVDSLASALISTLPNISSTLTVHGNDKITYKVGGVDTVIANNAKKTVTFDGQGGYTIA